MQVGAIVRKAVDHWSSGWKDALTSAIAAGLSWQAAHQLLGHPQPIFAAVAAIVFLSPGLPSHERQAVHMMLGVVTGILVGDLLLHVPLFSILLLVPVFSFALHIAIITFAAMMAALSFGLAPVITIQAGISAILVIAMGPAMAGPARLMDVVVGTTVGLVFSQILLTPDPVRVIDDAVRNMLRLLGAGFAQDAEALAEKDQQKAQAALSHFIAGHDNLVALRTSIASARTSARWSLRGWLVARGVAEMAERYDRRAIRLYASTLLFGEALANELRRGDEPPPSLRDRVARVAQACESLAGESMAIPALVAASATEDPPSPGWRTCLEHLRAVEQALSTLRQTADSSESTAGEARPTM